MPRPALVLAAALAFGLALGVAATPAAAQPSPYGVGDERAQTGDPAPAAAPARPWAQAPAPDSQMRAPEQLSGRPSGFWTSTRPAKGGRYRWRIMAAGGAVLAVTMFFVIRLLVRSSRARTTAPATPTRAA